jgi:hypothetical protein
LNFATVTFLQGKVTFYDSQGYGGGTVTSLHIELIPPCVYLYVSN